MAPRLSPWFRAVGFLTSGFVITVFVMIAGLFSDPKLAVNIWINRYGTGLLLAEVGLLIFCGLGAMLTDRPVASPTLTSANDNKTSTKPTG